MEGFKEFQGRNLDDAIGRACAYFDVPREKLEIDIIRDSKSGIFGIVGAQKAMIKARRAQAQNFRQRELSDTPEAARDPASSAKEERKNGREAAPPPKAKATETKPAAAPPPKIDEEDDEGESQTLFLDKVPPAPVYEDLPPAGISRNKPVRNGGGHGNRPAPGPRRPRPETPSPRPEQQESFSKQDLAEENSEGLPELTFEDMDCERLKALCLETVERMAEPVAGPVGCELRLADGRVHVTVNCEENSGILIGREGQTLAAMQYLASRIVSRAMNAAVRINLDAGAYRQRQDDKLRELATNLAARVKSTGRPYSTRPLSSYHRRIIHLTLQDDEAVQTRSLGEGPLKRVVIQRRR